MKVVTLLLALALLAAGGVHAEVIERGGDIGALILPAGAVAGTLFTKDYRGLAQFTEAFTSAMGLVYILKPTIDRTRPDGGHQSFPSGHTASAFAGAAFLQRHYGWRLGAPAYGIAAFVGYSRVEAKRHYTSDVIAGAAIGIGTNLIFTHARVHVSPGVSPERNRAGPVVTLTW